MEPVDSSETPSPPAQDGPPGAGGAQGADDLSQFPSRIAISASDPHFKGSAAFNAGNINNNFFGGGGAADPSGEHELFRVSGDSLELHGPCPDAELTSARGVLSERRMLYLLHDDDRRSDCRHVRVTLLKEMGAAGRTLLTASTLDLSRHLAYTDFKPHRPFVLFFEERAFERIEANLRYLTSDAQCGRLHELLKALDSFVVIPVSAAVQRHRECEGLDWAGRRAVRFEAPAGAAAACEAPPAPSLPQARGDDDDPVMGMVRFVAAFLPGLSIAQFDALVVRLLEAAQPSADAAAETARRGRRFQAERAPVSLAAHWRAQSDRIAERAGVAYCRGQSGQPGYRFADPAEGRAVKSFLLERRPAWLGRQLDLVEHWLLNEPMLSVEQQRCVRDFIVCLHQQGIALVDDRHLWRLLSGLLQADASRGTWARLHLLLAELLLVPSTAGATQGFLHALAQKCRPAAWQWLDTMAAWPETTAYVEHGDEEAEQALFQRFSSEVSANESIRQLRIFQNTLVSMLDRIRPESLLPLLVEAASEGGTRHKLASRLAVQQVVLAEPARWCLFSLLQQWMERSTHFLPDFCVAAAKHWSSPELRGAALERRWGATVLLHAALYVLGERAAAFVFDGDAKAGRALRAVFEDPQADELARAIGTAVRACSTPLRGEGTASASHARPFAMKQTVEFLELMVCALQKLEPTRTAATLARIDALAQALHSALDAGAQKELPRFLESQEKAYRRIKDAAALQHDRDGRRIWLWRIDALGALRRAHVHRPGRPASATPAP